MKISTKLCILCLYYKVLWYISSFSSEWGLGRMFHRISFEKQTSFLKLGLVVETKIFNHCVHSVNRSYKVTPNLINQNHKCNILEIFLESHGILAQADNIKAIITRQFSSQIFRIVVWNRTKPARTSFSIPETALVQTFSQTGKDCMSKYHNRKLETNTLYIGLNTISGLENANSWI